MAFQSYLAYHSSRACVKRKLWIFPILAILFISLCLDQSPLAMLRTTLIDTSSYHRGAEDRYRKQYPLEDETTGPIPKFEYLILELESKSVLDDGKFDFLDPSLLIRPVSLVVFLLQIQLPRSWRAEVPSTIIADQNFIMKFSCIIPPTDAFAQNISQ